MGALESAPPPWTVRLAARGGAEPDVYVDFTGDDGLYWSLARVYATAGNAETVGRVMSASVEFLLLGEGIERRASAGGPVTLTTEELGRLISAVDKARGRAR